MPSIPREFVTKIKHEIDIVNVVEEYVSLKKSGKNYMGLCPFHQEKTPSFSVNPEEQFYHCFGCGAGGDVINFVMEIDSLSFQESLTLLAERAGLELPGGDPVDQAELKLREAVFAANQLAARFYNYLLLKEDCAAEARSYLEERSYSSKDISNFQLGYAPDSWRSLLKFLSRRGFSEEVLLKAGLIGRASGGNTYDKFRNRIIFPIYNVRGEVLGFGARAISPDDQPKYLNSPETKIFSKKTILYGINWARSPIRKSGEAIVVEGYTDVLTGHKYGIENLVASLGTSLTREQARLLNRFAERVYIAYDADTAGNMATLRGLEILRQTGLRVSVIDLPEESDPDDIIISQGAETFLGYKDRARELVEYRLDVILEGYELKSPEDRLEAAREGINFLAELEDNLARETYARVLAEKTSLSAEKLQEEIEKQRSIKITNNNKRESKKRRRPLASASADESVDWQLLAAIIHNQKYRNQVLASLKPGYFRGETRQLAELIWQDPEITSTEILAEISGTKKQIVSRELLNSGREITRTRLAELTRTIKNRRVRTEINNLIEVLSEKENGEKFTINDILLYYKRLITEERRSSDE